MNGWPDEFGFTTDLANAFPGPGPSITHNDAGGYPSTDPYSPDDYLDRDEYDEEPDDEV